MGPPGHGYHANDVTSFNISPSQRVKYNPTTGRPWHCLSDKYVNWRLEEAKAGRSRCCRQSGRLLVALAAEEVPPRPRPVDVRDVQLLMIDERISRVEESMQRQVDALVGANAALKSHIDDIKLETEDLRSTRGPSRC